MSAKIDGLDRVIAKLDKLADMDGVRSGMEKACTAVTNAAKKKAPKDTGALRRSIQSEVKGSGKEVIGEVFTPLEYAPYVEFGTGVYSEKTGRSKPWAYKDDDGKWHTTKGMHPQPFMRPALQESKKQIVSHIKRGLSDSLR